jgi:hypothetical protein
MNIADAQRALRRDYRGGLAGQLVSGVLWAVSATIGTWYNQRLAVFVLVLGGFFIFPLTLLSLRLAGHRPGRNPLNALAMQVAFTVPLGLPLVLTIAGFSRERFFPAMMILVGAHYLPFMFLYGMWHWVVLAAAMLGGGWALGWMAHAGFATGGWITAVALALFGLVGWRVVVAEERAARP